MIVSNASTLILLAKVTALADFLNDTKKVAIPKIVYSEIMGKNSFDLLLIKKEIEKKRIDICDIESGEYSAAMAQFKLDEGEAAAYGLLKQKKGKAVLTDDGELIKLCKIEGIPFITAMAAVVKLFKKNKLTKEEASKKIDELYKHGWYSNEIYKYFKGMVI